MSRHYYLIRYAKPTELRTSRETDRVSWVSYYSDEAFEALLDRQNVIPEPWYQPIPYSCVRRIFNLTEPPNAELHWPVDLPLPPLIKD